MCNGYSICRSGKKICEKKCNDENYRVFMVDKTEIKLTKICTMMV